MSQLDQRTSADRDIEMRDNAFVMLGQMSERLQNIDKKISADKPDKPSPWYIIAVQVIGLPAAMLTLYLQFSQVGDAGLTRQKTLAETENIKIETEKNKLDLQKTLNDLASKKAEGQTAYQAEVNQVAPKLQELLNRISAERWVGSPSLGSKVLVQYIILWAAYQGIGLVETIVFAIITTLLNIIQQIIFSIRWSSRGRELSYRLTPIFSSMTHTAVNVLFWAVRLVVFLSVIIPFMDEAIVLIGGEPGSFRAIASEFTAFHFAKAIALLDQVLGFSPGQS